jgi:rhodanese-related sulfurtransferase
MNGGVTQISVLELKRRLDQGAPLTLLDVREDQERAFCTIDRGGIHVPMAELPARLDEVRAAALPLVVYCHHGVRSLTAAAWLAERGIGPIYNLQGGIDAWSVLVDPRVPRY